MVVTPCTTDRQPHHGPGCDINLLVDHVHLEQGLVSLVERLGPHGQERGGNLQAVPFLGRLGLDQVAGHLLADELVEWHIAIEGVDHVPAVSPGVGEGVVAFHAGRFGEPRHVEPVSAPAFAKVRRFEQPVDEMFQGIGPLVLEEGLELPGCGRKADEVEVKSACERDLVGIADGCQVSRLDTGQDEVVDRGDRPLVVFDVWQWSGLWWLEGPETASLLDVDLAADQRGSFALPGIGCSHFDPADQVGNFLLRELLLGRHLEALVPDRFDQQALAGFSRYHGRTALAAGGPTGPAVQQQAPLDRLGLGRVAAVAPGHQQRPDLLFEERQLLGGGLLDLRFACWLIGSLDRNGRGQCDETGDR